MQLRAMHLALNRSVAVYAPPAWFPRAARTKVEQLEIAQLAVARTITKLLGTTHKEEVRHKANLQPLALLAEKEDKSSLAEHQPSNALDLAPVEP